MHKQVVNIRGQKISFKTRDSFWKNAESGLWEKVTFDIVQKYVTPGSVFIDIGAWIGPFSIYAARLGAKVYSVEPDPIAYREFRENIVLNGVLDTVNSAKIAIADKDGSVILKSAHNNFGNSESSLLDRGGFTGHTDVSCLTIESYVEAASVDLSKLSLIKMDIEGGESIVIPSSWRFFRKNRVPVALSLHPFWFDDMKDGVSKIFDRLSRYYNFFTANGVEGKSTEDMFMFINAGAHDFLLLPK